MLRELCCLAVPFAAKSFSELAQRLKRAAIPRPLPSRFDQNINRITARLLNHKPEARSSILHDVVNDPFVAAHTRDVSQRLGDLWPVACIRGEAAAAGPNVRNGDDADSTPNLAVGDRVEGNYCGKGKWCVD